MRIDNISQNHGTQYHVRVHLIPQELAPLHRYGHNHRYSGNSPHQSADSAGTLTVFPPEMLNS